MVNCVIGNMCSTTIQGYYCVFIPFLSGEILEIYVILPTKKFWTSAGATLHPQRHVKEWSRPQNLPEATITLLPSLSVGCRLRDNQLGRQTYLIQKLHLKQTIRSIGRYCRTERIYLCLNLYPAFSLG